MADAPAEEQVVFSNTVESLLVRALKGKLTDDVVADIRALGIDLSAPLRPAYAAAPWFRVLELVAKRTFRELPLEEAYNQMGRLLITQYQETLVGRALFATLRILPQRRALARTARSFRTGNNYTVVEVVEIGPTCTELLFNAIEPSAALTQGVLQEGLAAIGFKEVNVEIVWTDGKAARFRVSWVE